MVYKQGRDLRDELMLSGAVRRTEISGHAGK